MSDGGARPKRLALSSLLNAYLGAVIGLGSVGLLAALLGTSWTTITTAAVWPLLFLGVAALVGELKPLPVSRTDEPVETISTSVPFILALVAVGGVGVAVLAQVFASLADDARNRRDLKKSAFNTAQYSLSVLAARAAFCWLTDVPFLGGPMTVEVGHLAPLLAAGVVMVVTNRLLVAVVVSIVTSQPLRHILRDDATFFVATQAVLLCIGGVAAYVAAAGVPVLALLVAPVAAVYLTAAAAIRSEYQATHDSLTGLGNRDRLHTELDRGLSAATAATGGLGLVLLDLDHFKDINDSLGHPVGDRLLRHVADRLVAALGEHGAVHRLGGDEFAVVVDGDSAKAHAVARQLLAALEAPMPIGELELLVRASAGVAVAPAHGRDAETLMKNADIALYQAKLDRDGIRMYSEEFDVNTLERLQLLADLRTAIDSGQLRVAYQPQLDMVSRRIVGVEALIRWQHPVRGAVPPDSFIPLAENSGVISELTAYVLDTALDDLARWRRAGHDLRIAVNLSARHLSDLALPRQVADALARHAVPATALVLEVTETGILSDPARADVVIADLRSLGVAIAVDDYGTGHASLGYLKKLDVDELKIDRSFVMDMGRDHHDYVIVRSTVGMARDLGLRVVAEGIEDEETAVSLRALGCDTGQGYHLGRPTTAEQILERLHAELPVLSLTDGPGGD